MALIPFFFKQDSDTTGDEFTTAQEDKIKELLDQEVAAFDPDIAYVIGERVFYNGYVQTAVSTTAGGGAPFDQEQWERDNENLYYGTWDPALGRPKQTAAQFNNRWIREGAWLRISQDGTITDGVDTLVVKESDFLIATQDRPSNLSEWAVNAAKGSDPDIGILPNFDNANPDHTIAKNWDAQTLTTWIDTKTASEGDAAGEWVGGFDYVGVNNKIFTFSTTSTTAVDIEGNPIEANTNYIGKYPIDKTSSATLDDTELLSIEVLGISSSSSFRYVNPDSGDDTRKGETVGTDWKTFAPINTDPAESIFVTIVAGVTEIPAVTINKNVTLNFETGSPRVRRLTIKDSNVRIIGTPIIEAFTIQGGELIIDSDATIQGEGVSNFYDAFRLEKGNVFINEDLTFTGGHRFPIHTLINAGVFRFSERSIVNMNGYTCTGLIIGGAGRIFLPSQTIATGATFEFGISTSGTASVWRPPIAQTVEDEFIAGTDVDLIRIGGYSWLEGWSNHLTIIERFQTTDLLAPYTSTNDPITRITVNVGRTANGWQAIGDFAINLIGGGTVPPANMTLENVTGGVITAVEAQSIIDGNFTGLAFAAIGDTESFDIVFDTPRSDIESLTASGRADWPTTGIGFTTQTQGNPSQTNKILSPVQTPETFPILPIETDVTWHWGHFTDGTGTGVRAVNDAGVTIFEVHEIDGIRVPSSLEKGTAANFQDTDADYQVVKSWDGETLVSRMRDQALHVTDFTVANATNVEQGQFIIVGEGSNYAGTWRNHSNTTQLFSTINVNFTRISENSRVFTTADIAVANSFTYDQNSVVLIGDGGGTWINNGTGSELFDSEPPWIRVDDPLETTYNVDNTTIVGGLVDAYEGATYFDWVGADIDRRLILTTDGTETIGDIQAGTGVSFAFFQTLAESGAGNSNSAAILPSGTYVASAALVGGVAMNFRQISGGGGVSESVAYPGDNGIPEASKDNVYYLDETIGALPTAAANQEISVSIIQANSGDAQATKDAANAIVTHYRSFDTGAGFIWVESEGGSGLRKQPIADITALVALSNPTDATHQTVLDDGTGVRGEYVFELGKTPAGTDVVDVTATGAWVKIETYGTVASDEIGTLKQVPNVDETGTAMTNADYAAKGLLPLINGYTLTDGATNNPKFALMYPTFVSGNDLLVPSTFDGDFVRNLGGNAAAFMTSQADEVQSHNHNTGIPVFGAEAAFGTTTAGGGNGGAANWSSTGNVNKALTNSVGGTETRPENFAMQFCLVLDSYSRVLMVDPDLVVVTPPNRISRNGNSNPGNGNPFQHGTETLNEGDITYAAGVYTIGTSATYSINYGIQGVSGQNTGFVSGSLFINGVAIGSGVGLVNDASSNFPFGGSSEIQIALTAGDIIEFRQTGTPGFGGTNKTTSISINQLSTGTVIRPGDIISVLIEGDLLGGNTINVPLVSGGKNLFDVTMKLDNGFNKFSPPSNTNSPTDTGGFNRWWYDFDPANGEINVARFGAWDGHAGNYRIVADYK